VEGEIPAGIRGAFYRVGPDFQYPPKFPDNIPFDGEGNVAMFRFADGHVDLKTRYVRTQRFKAQEAARQALFGMYRNPYTDDPAVHGLSRGTANTHVVYHAGTRCRWRRWMTITPSAASSPARPSRRIRSLIRTPAR
jgi:carotenoid cleavage dioxygenase-like enzyme